MKAYAIKDNEGKILPSTCSEHEDVPSYIYMRDFALGIEE